MSMGFEVLGLSLTVVILSKLFRHSKLPFPQVVKELVPFLQKAGNED